jgi:hypothetical protein
METKMKGTGKKKGRYALRRCDKGRDRDCCIRHPSLRGSATAQYDEKVGLLWASCNHQSPWPPPCRGQSGSASAMSDISCVNE